MTANNITIYTEIAVEVVEFCYLLLYLKEENEMMEARILISFNNALIAA